MIVDSHIHLYPEYVFKDPGAWAEKRGENYWLSCVAPPARRSLQAWKTVDELLRDMDDAGVSHAIILAWYWESHDTCLEAFDWQKDWIDQHPDRLSAFAPFNAKAGPPAVDLAKKALDSGFIGIGELNPPAQGYAYDDPYLGQALELAAQYGAAVNFHVTDPTSPPYPGKIDTPYPQLLRLAVKHPETQFVFAHLGGGEPLRHEAAPPANVSFDTAACPLLYKKPVYREFCDKVGPAKLLFGTDYPLRAFPSDPHAPNFTAPLDELRRGGLTESEFQDAVASNPQNLFKLQQPKTPS